MKAEQVLLYLREWILDERFVSDQIEEADPGAVESQDVLRSARIFQLGINTADLNRTLFEQLRNLFFLI